MGERDTLGRLTTVQISGCDLQKLKDELAGLIRYTSNECLARHFLEQKLRDMMSIA